MTSTHPLTETHVRAERIKNRIIDVILASPLNVPFIPDDVERDIYMTLLTELEPIVTDRTFWNKVLQFIRKLFSCCFKKPQNDNTTGNGVNLLNNEATNKLN